MNYSELRDAAIAYADRYDVEVSDNIDIFILMVEARANRVLKTREQSVRAYIATVTDQEYYSLPDDYAGMRDIQYNDASPLVTHSVAQYNYLSPEQMNDRRGSPFNGENYYTVIADQLHIFPCQDTGGTLEMVYYQKVPNLNSTDTNNWMSDSHPDIYLAGMVAEIEIFAKNYEAGELWYTRMTTMIQELENSDNEERWSGAALQTRIG